MKQSYNAKTLWMMILVLLLIVGCSLPMNVTPEIPPEGQIQTHVAETMVAMQVDDAVMKTMGAQAPPEVTASTQEILINSTITLTPTITLTGIVEKLMVSVSEDTNCRNGPGKTYDYLGALLVGEQAEVVGQSMDGQYWIIKNPDRAGECWLWGQYASVTGPTAALPRYTPPPTPTPKHSPTQTMTPTQTLTPTLAYDLAGTWDYIIAPSGGAVSIVWSMDIMTGGGEFVGSGAFPGGIRTFNGTISTDGLSVNGVWADPGGAGSFTIFALGVNQFQGNIDGDGFCGVRGGATWPEPCFKN